MDMLQLLHVFPQLYHTRVLCWELQHERDPLDPDARCAAGLPAAVSVAQTVAAAAAAAGGAAVAETKVDAADCVIIERIGRQPSGRAKRQRRG